MQIDKQIRRQITYILTQAFGCLFGGIFLLTLQDALVPVPYWMLQTLGYIFLAVSFFLVISPFNNLLIKWANKIDYYLSGMLMVITFALVIKTGVDIKAHGFMLVYVLVIVWVILFYAQVMLNRHIP